MHVYTCKYFLHDSKTKLVLNNERQTNIWTYHKFFLARRCTHMSLVNPVLLSKDKI